MGGKVGVLTGDTGKIGLALRVILLKRADSDELIRGGELSGLDLTKYFVLQSPENLQPVPV